MAISATRISYGPTTPNKPLGQSSDGSIYVPSHLFPSGGNSMSSLRDQQEDTYLTLNPQRATNTTTATAWDTQAQPAKTSTPMGGNAESSFAYYLASTPYKHTQSTPKDKTPGGELPPTKSVYDVVGTRHDATGLADTSMGEADIVGSGNTGDERAGYGLFGAGFNAGASAGAGAPAGGESAWGASNRIDWDEDTHLQGRSLTGSFAGSRSFFDQRNTAASGFGSPIPQQGLFTHAQSPPFKGRNDDLGDPNAVKSEELWLTVFGFPPTQAASNVILKYFQELGDVVQFEQPVGMNWLHLCYRLKQHADRSLVKNGKLIGESMIGVLPRSETTHLPSAAHTIVAKDPSKIYDRNAVLLPPKEQSWVKSVLSFTFG